MTWLWPLAPGRSPRWLVVFGIGLTAFAVWAVNVVRLLAPGRGPVQTFALPTAPVLTGATPVSPIPSRPAFIMPAVKPGRVIPDAALPPVAAPIPARPFATVPDNPADHPYKPRHLDLD